MDGSVPTGQLPTVPSYAQGGPATAQPPTPAPGLAPVQPPAGGSPGKPHQDPDKQEARNLKHQERQRLENILPASAKEGHFAVFELKGNTGRRFANATKPVIQVLISEIEDAQSDINEFIFDLLEEKNLMGRFLVIARDKHGKKLGDIPEWEIGSDDDYEEDEVTPASPGQMPMGGMGMGGYAPAGPEYGLGYDPNLPPHLRGSGYTPGTDSDKFDPEGYKEVIQAESDKSAKSNYDMVGMITQMMNQQQVMQSNAQQMTTQMQMQSEERRRESDDRRRDDENRREERYRQERAEQSNGRIQLLTAVIPVLMPVIQKMMDSKPDTMMPLVLKMMDGNQNKDAMSQMMTLMTEGSRQTMQLYGEANKSVQESQASAMGNMMSTLLDTSKMVTAAAVEAAQNEDDDPLDKFAKIAPMAAPILKNFQQQQSIQMPAADPSQIPQMPQGIEQEQPPHDALSAVSTAPVPATAPPQQPAAAPAPTKDQRIESIMTSIYRLHSGELGPEHRKPMMIWAISEMKDNIPELYEAVLTQNQDKVYELGAPTATNNEAIFNWLTDGGDAFLTDFLEEVRQIETAGDVTDSAELSQEEIDEVNDNVMRAPLPPESKEPPAEEQPVADGDEGEDKEEKPEEKAEEKTE